MGYLNSIISLPHAQIEVKERVENKTENDAHIVYKKKEKERIENEPLHNPKER